MKKRTKKEELKEYEEKAIKMIFVLFDQKHMTLLEVYQYLCENHKNLYEEISEQKFKMMNEEPEITFWQKILTFFSHRQETIDESILKSLVKEFKITCKALEFITRRSKEEFLNQGRDPKYFLDY